MVSMVQLKKINEEKRKFEVMVKIFWKKTPLELGFMQVEKYNICYIYLLQSLLMVVMLNF
jgi:hypothetical protein